MKYKHQYGITTVSSPSEVYSSYGGPLIHFPVVQSINREKGTLRRWIVFSNGKRSTLVLYLFGKWLWDELTNIEQKLFWSLNEITKDTTIYLSFKAYALGISKRLLRKRLLESPFTELKAISREQYLSRKGRVTFFLIEEQISLRKTPKYSGYTKHYKDKGSLRTNKEEILSEMLDPVIDVSYDTLLSYLTVGEISLFGGVTSS